VLLDVVLNGGICLQMATFHQLISVNQGMVIFLMNKQTLVTSCPTRMYVKRGSLQFASLQHSEKNKTTSLLLDKTMKCIDQRELCESTLMFKKSEFIVGSPLVLGSMVLCVPLNYCLRGEKLNYKCFYRLSKIYNFRNIVHFLKRILQVVDNAVFWQNVLLYFENDPLSPSF